LRPQQWQPKKGVTESIVSVFSY